MILYLSVTFILFLYVLYYLARPGLRRAGLYLTDFFILNLTLYNLGILGAIYYDGFFYAEPLMYMALISLGSALIGGIIGALAFRHNYPASYVQNIIARENSSFGERLGIRLGLVLCVIVCLLFINSVVHSTSLHALVSLSEIRKSITAGTYSYFAPGFVKQFRDILVPIFAVAVGIIAAGKNGRVGDRLLALSAVLVAFLAMLLAGVRSNIMFLIITLIIGRLYISQISSAGAHRIAHKFWMGVMAALAFTIFVTLSVLQGRVAEGESVMTYIQQGFVNLTERIVMRVPRENAETFDYWSEIGPTNGKFWLDELASVLPGPRGMGLSNELHSVLGGSLEGNSPLGMPADIWMAWGWLGLLIVPFLYALVIGWFDLSLTVKRIPVYMSIKIVLALALVKIYSPFGFILYGGGVSLILWLGIKIIRINQSNKVIFVARPNARSG